LDLSQNRIDTKAQDITPFDKIIKLSVSSNLFF